MRILLYILILAAVLLVPNQGTDVGKLIPVEVIALSREEDMVTVRTDTGDEGKGGTLFEAFENLEDTAAGIIYLDTAEYLLTEPGFESADELKRYLKGSTKVYYAEGDISMDGIADYLSVQEHPVRLKTMQESGRIPTITENNGRFLVTEE